uniref:Uncharacterized protein n=1 Tax=Siphoviridae sp. ctTnV63 TaxID=2825523 RepID=A0A8S5NV12_9CAUD|nr:MAG TPA: hypothetical protein [Siphoviridae sp. ctTnV63]
MRYGTVPMPSRVELSLVQGGTAISTEVKARRHKRHFGLHLYFFHLEGDELVRLYILEIRALVRATRRTKIHRGYKD